MKGCGRYDAELHMFVEQPREPDLRLLRFLRWLAKRDRLEHRPLSRPRGRYARRREAGRVTNPNREARRRSRADSERRAGGHGHAFDGG